MDVTGYKLKNDLSAGNVPHPNFVGDLPAYK